MMKTMNLKNLMNGILFGVLVVMLMLASVGCGKKKSDNNNFNNCQNGYCQNNGGTQPGYGSGIVGLGYDVNSGSEVYLEFVGQQNQFDNLYFMTGSVLVYGQIDTSSIQCSYGGYVPGGQYIIEPYNNQPANAQSGIVSNAYLVAYGQNGIQLEIILSSGRIELPLDGGGQYDSLWANMTVESVNGQPCNGLMTVYPW